MLGLSRDSLHYRVYTMFGLYRWRLGASPKNLCRYFWATVLGYLLPFGLLGGLVYVSLRWPKIVLEDTAFIVGTLVFAGAVIGLAFGIAKAVEAIQDRNRNRYHEPNIVLEYVKAKKRKVCPMIEWR